MFDTDRTEAAEGSCTAGDFFLNSLQNTLWTSWKSTINTERKLTCAHMKKLLLAVISVVITGCASIGFQEGYSNQAEIRKVLLPDSTSAYIIDWKGHTYIYTPGSTPNVTEIRLVP